MGWSKKDTVDEYRNIDIFWLRARGLLRGCDTSLSWKNHWGENSIGLTIDIDRENVSGKMRLVYTTTNREGEKKNIDYTIDMESTPCFYGGWRFWFRCPNYHCQKRVAKLYQNGEYFICRHCASLTYESCQKSGSSFFFGKLIDQELKFEKLREKTKIYVRKGTLTKKATKLWNMKENMNYLFAQSEKMMKKRQL